MDQKIIDFENKRKKSMITANIFFYIGLGLTILSGILLLILLGTGNESFQSFIVPLVFGIVGFIVSSAIKNSVSKEFKKTFVPALIKEMYPDSTYEPEHGIALNVVLEPGFFRYPDRYFLEDFISATYDGIPFAMSDFTLQEEHTTTDSKGNTRTTYETYANGRFMVFDFKRDFKEVVKITEPKYIYNTKGLEKVETESLEFNDKFTVRTSNPLTAFYVLTPQMQLKILEFEKKFKGSIYLAFMYGKLYVAICDSVSILDVKVGKKTVEELKEIIISQLNIPAAVINEFGLNTDKYNKGDAI